MGVRRTEIELPSDSETTQTNSLEAYAALQHALAMYRDAGGVGPGMPTSKRIQIQAALDRAVGLDKNFAAPHAWKAYIYVDSLFFDAATSDERAGLSALVERHAERALLLDSHSATAEVARARLDLFYSRFALSRAALERARRSAPNDPRVLQQLALVHCLLGDFRAGIAVAREALDLNANNPGILAPLAVALQLTGKHADAAAAAQAMIEAAPGASIGYILLARAEIARGNLAKAHEALTLAERLPDQSLVLSVDLAMGYRRVGVAVDAERLVGTLPPSASPAIRAAALLARGDDSNALATARTAVASRGLGADPLQLAALEWNVWSLPALEQRPWRDLRARMSQR